MPNPRSGNFLVCWPMYREGEDVFFRNAIIFLDEIEGACDPAAPWGCVGHRDAVDEDGNKISEWITSVESLRGFFGGPSAR